MPRWHFLPWLALLVACSNGRDKLIAALQAPRPDERAIAVKKLAEMGNAEDLGLFTQAAKDPVPIVRGEAVVALGKSQDPRVVDLLGDLLGDENEEVQAKAAMALAGFRTEKAKSYLTLQYGRRGRATRQVIVQALKASNVPGAMAGVVAAEASYIWERNFAALKDGSLPERVGAAEALGKSGRPEAVNRLVPLLKDNQVMLAAAAVRGLGNAGDKRAAGPISELLKESYPQLREAACEALMQLQDSAALPRLLEVAMEKSPSSALATQAIVVLPKGPETDKALCEIVLTSDAAEVAVAGQAMRKRGGCALEPVLEKLKSSSAGQVAALRAIGALGAQAKEAAAKVVPLLTSSDAVIRKLAVDALVEIGDPQVSAALLKAYEAELKQLEPLRADWITAVPSAPAHEVVAAGEKVGAHDLLKKVDALNEARAQAAGKVLLTEKPPREIVDDASDSQLSVLASLVRALGELKVENAQSVVSAYRDESSPSLRAAAFVALAALKPEEASAGLLDADRDVQGATALALAETEEGQAIILRTLPKIASDRTRLLEPLRGRLLAKGGVAVLLDLIKEGGAEAGSAALLLGEIGSADAVEPLMKYLDDSKAVARREVLMALGRLKDPRAAEAVGHDLYHDSSDVRVAAAQALASLGTASHGEALDALKGDYYRDVREAAQAALSALGEVKH